MRGIAFSILLFGAACAAPACAADLGGTAQSGATKPVLVQGGGLAFTGLDGGTWGVSVPLTGETGVFGWGRDYRLDATLQPNLGGGYTAGIGAAVGAMPGQPGGTYALRLGAGWLADQVGLNAASGSAPVATPQSPSDLNLSLGYSQSLLPGLSFSGGAEAHRGMGGGVDPTTEANQIIIGAGIGMRF